MSDELTTLAQKEEAKRKAKKEQKRRAQEDFNKWFVPATALAFANIIFFSLDIRAFQAIYIITGSYLLAALTVVVSGGLAMYWFDVLYPHSRKHNNDTQKNISIVFTILAICLSGVLAFADYVVGTGNAFSTAWSNILWAVVVVLTIAQGIAIAVWWSIDNHNAAEARIQEAHADAADKADDMQIMRTNLQGLRGVLDELEKLDKDFSPSAVNQIANMLGIALPDRATPANKEQRPPNLQPARTFASDAENPTKPSPK